MELAHEFTISQPAVTKHLNVLAEARIITRRRAGRLRYCRLRLATLDASLAWLAPYRRLWKDRLDTLETLLAAELAPKEEHPDADDR
jgi:DNA-binding transcriptional ArsR family regulator